MEEILQNKTPFEQIRHELTVEYTIPSHLGISEARRYIQRIYGTLKHNETQIGTLDGTRLLIDMCMENKESLFDLWDIDGDIMNIGERIFDFKTNEFTEILKHHMIDVDYGFNALILEDIEIIPEYRGKAIGKYFIKDWYNHFGSGCALIIVHFSEDITGKDKSFVHLISYFTALGFTMIPIIGNDLMFLSTAMVNESFRNIVLD